MRDVCDVTQQVRLLLFVSLTHLNLASVLLYFTFIMCLVTNIYRKITRVCIPSIF